MTSPTPPPRTEPPALCYWAGCCRRVVHLYRLATVEHDGRTYALTDDVVAAVQLHARTCRP